MYNEANKHINSFAYTFCQGGLGAPHNNPHIKKRETPFCISSLLSLFYVFHHLSDTNFIFQSCLKNIRFHVEDRKLTHSLCVCTYKCKYLYICMYVGKHIYVST